MRFMRRVLWILFAMVAVLGCKSSKLADALPAPPAGWAAEGKPVVEEVDKLGTRAVGTYKATGDANGIDRIEVHYAVRARGAYAGERPPSMVATDAPAAAPGTTTITAQFMPPFWKELRKHPANKSEMLIMRKVGDRAAFESPPYDDEAHLLTLHVADDVEIDLVAYGKAKAGDKTKALEAFAKQIDFERVKKLGEP